MIKTMRRMRRWLRWQKRRISLRWYDGPRVIVPCLERCPFCKSRFSFILQMEDVLQCYICGWIEIPECQWTIPPREEGIIGDLES